MLLYFSSFRLVNIHSLTHSHVHAKKNNINNVNKNNGNSIFIHIHTHCIVHRSVPYHTADRSCAWDAKSKMWQEATVRIGAESLLFLFLCLLYAAFGKVNAYAVFCINVAFQWVNIKNWAWKKAKWRRKTFSNGEKCMQCEQHTTFKRMIELKVAVDIVDSYVLWFTFRLRPFLHFF